MSNACKCPRPPGGTIRCSDDQLAVCGYQDGEIVSGCFDRPELILSIADEGEKNLVLSNWILSKVTGVYRSDLDPIDSDLFAMLRSGQYRNERTGEVLKFSLPRDLDLERAASLKPITNTY